jgi:hypothetical protein
LGEGWGEGETTLQLTELFNPQFLRVFLNFAHPLVTH